MQFKRITDASYPNVYDTWSTESATWVIQDLRPEDDDVALQILKDNLCPDETLCKIQKLMEDPASVHHMVEFWREYLAQRMSLGCYEVKGGKKSLVALNVCMAVAADEDHDIEVKGEKWKNVYDVVKYAETKVNPFKYLGLDIILEAMGLVVKREYRGAKLGKRLLAAREPLCKTQGIKGTATIFSSIAAQKLAASCGFETISEVRISELADVGMPYPKDDDRVLKYMVKKFVEPLCKTQGIKGTATIFTGIASQKLAASCGFETISEIRISELADVGMPYPKDDDRVLKYMVKKFV